MTRIGVRARVLVSVLACALIGLASIIFTMAVVITDARLQQLHQLDEEVGRFNLDDCEADPAGWSAEYFTFRFFGHGASGASLNPDSPPLPASALAELEGGEPVVFDDFLFRLPRDAGALKVADEGSCQILVARPMVPGLLWPGVSVGLMTGLLVGVPIAVGGVMFLAVRPLVRRLERLDVAAGAVGGEGFGGVGDASEDELGRIARTLEAAHRRIRADHEELSRRHQALESHLDALAHDLRTPLASLHLSLEAARERGDSPELRQATLESAYLTALIDNLHQAARLRHGFDPAADGARVDLAEVVRRVGLRFGLLGRASEVSVHAGAPDGALWAACDPFLAERALSNLVHNAIVHGRPGGQVGVLLETLDGGRWRISVIDDGPGVPREVRVSLARRGFTATPSRTRGDPASGLGLAVVGEVCRRVGWGLRYEEAPEGGLQVRIEGAAATSPGPAPR